MVPDLTWVSGSISTLLTTVCLAWCHLSPPPATVRTTSPTSSAGGSTWAAQVEQVGEQVTRGEETEQESGELCLVLDSHQGHGTGVIIESNG